MQRGAQADRGKEVRGRAEAPGDKKDHEVRDCLLGERMYGGDGLKQWGTGFLPILIQCDNKGIINRLQCL